MLQRQQTNKNVIVNLLKTLKSHLKDFDISLKKLPYPMLYIINYTLTIALHN